MIQRNMYESLQKALVEARQSKGLTQTEIATRLGKPQSFVSKYESGERRLDVVEFLEVCQALSVKPNSILNKIDIDKA
jgi:transcriptional regulator with XRE-family HTH domain